MCIKWMSIIKKQSEWPTELQNKADKKEAKATMTNERVIKTIAANMLKRWEVAKLMKISEMTLYRKLREEMPEEEQNKICLLIEEYVKKGDNHNA